MSTASTETQAWTWYLRATLISVVVGGPAVTARAQYYYQPSPDYYRNDTVEGTVLGGAFGAVSGAILGGKKDRKEGALIGAGVGALAGNLLGRKKDRADEHRAAVGASTVANANAQAARRAITNFDLIRMTQAGVGDELIISTIRARGARLDLSPDALISLKENGVSERVLIAAQTCTQGGTSAPPLPQATVIYDEAPAPVIYTPVPRRVYHYHPYHRRHGRRVHYHFRF